MIFTLILNKAVLLEFLETCLTFYFKKTSKSSVSASLIKLLSGQPLSNVFDCEYSLVFLSWH